MKASISRSGPWAGKGIRGFSLVEMLVVIGVIGVIASMALVSISAINDNAQITWAKRRAQDIATVFTAGVAAGAPSFISATNVREAQNAVGIGDHGIGRFSGVLFRLAGVSENADDALPVAARSGYYLTWQDGALAYDKTGGHFN